MRVLELKRPAPAPADAGATVLFTVLSFALCSAVLSSIALYEADQAAVVAGLRSAQRQAYWLARGQARQDLADLSEGRLTAGEYSRSYACGTTQTSVTQGARWTVKVTARTGESVDVISFVYDSASGQVVQWQDAGPP